MKSPRKSTKRLDLDTMLDSALSLFAQAAGGAAAPAQGAPDGGGLGGSLQPLIFFGIPLALAWFILLRPAQKQEKERKKAIYQIKRGDDVTFAGGLLGTVAGIKEKNPGTPSDNDEITVKVIDSKLRVLRSSIYAIVPASEESKDTVTA
jgi:preprotein translocase subunit YajC